MEKWIEALKVLGFEVGIFIAGLAGAWVSSNKVKLRPFERVTAVLSGGFIANYLTPVLIEIIGFSDSAHYGTGFIIGYIGMRSVEYVIDFIHRKFDIKDERND